MAVVFQGHSDADSACIRCELPLPSGEEIFVYCGRTYCSLICIADEVEDPERPGADFVATQDQAIAAIHEVLATQPQQFAFLWQPRDPEGGDIGVTIFCRSPFLVECVEALAMATVEAEPSVRPPDEG
jgi:hypothetical protein